VGAAGRQEKEEEEKVSPYSRKARFRHYRQRKPSDFKKGSLRTVPLSHSGYRGKKFKGTRGAKAVVGRLKGSGRWSTQSILVPKKKGEVRK